MAIHFFNEESNYKLKQKSELKQWIKAIAAEEGFKIIFYVPMNTCIR